MEAAMTEFTDSVKAKSFFGDGSDLTVKTKDGEQPLKDALNSKLNISGGDLTGPLTITNRSGSGIGEPGAELEISGNVRAATFEATNPLRHRMYPDEPIVYQEIFKAKKDDAIAKLGEPFYDDTTYQKKFWNDRHLIRFGGNNEPDGNGALVIIPPGYDTVWVRVLGERWTVIKAKFWDSRKENLGLWPGGFRSANCYCPDGSLTDSYYNVHQWMPIPAGRSGKLALIVKPYTNNHFWLSGLAFSKNPWAHAVQSAVGYHWAVNGGDKTVWSGGWENWNNDSLTKINPKTKWLLKVPVVPSGRDKLLYLVEHNNNWNGCMHNGISVNGKKIERFLATYDNPFARHWNSKWYNRYIAARIPAALIPANARWLDVRIDMSKQNQGIHFREAGTHDLDIPWSD
jgi:hypothetical protein